MTALVIGGAGSGKSAFAEKLLCRLSGNARRAYLAAMEPFGPEAEARIRRHRAARAGKDFVTVECYVNLTPAMLPSGSAALLEDVGNVCANALFSPRWEGLRTAQGIVEAIGGLAERCQTLVLVTNETFCDGMRYGEDTLRWLSALSYVNRKLAAGADAVYEVSSGMVERWKGTDACGC